MNEPPSHPVAIVTGASAGVGQQIVRQLVAKGWRVACAARTRAALEAAVDGCGNAASCLAVPTDVSDSEQCAALVDRTVEAFGRVDALVNNAGMASLIPIQDVDAGALRDSFAVNTFGPGVLIAKVFPLMRKQKHGRIVNVSSVSSQDPFPGFFAYGAAKSALESFTRSVEIEGKRHNVRAFSLAPGAIETGMLRSMFSKDHLPANKALDPAEVAAIAVACAAGERDEDAGKPILILPS